MRRHDERTLTEHRYRVGRSDAIARNERNLDSVVHAARLNTSAHHQTFCGRVLRFPVEYAGDTRVTCQRCLAGMRNA